MIKTIKTSDLRVGMYVRRLHRKWYQHSFFFNRFLLNSPQKLKKILSCGIEEVDIDTSKGLDVIPTPPPHAKEPSDSGPSGNLLPASNRIDKETAPLAQTTLNYPMTLGVEISQAREVLTDAGRVVGEIMSDVRFGHPLDTQKVEHTVCHITESVLKSPEAMIGLSRIKNLDNYTFEHSVGVCALMVAFCRDFGLDEQTVQQVGTGGLLHDIGKMQLPAEFLHRRCKFTHEEYRVMQKHVEFGERILERIPNVPQIVMEIACQHHEREDGSGYPGHKKGAELSWYGQIAAIADMYDAAISQRSYQRILEPTEALHQIYEMRSTFLNPELVERFIKFIGIYPFGTLVSLDNGSVGFVLRSNRNDALSPLVRIVYDGKRKRAVPQYDLDLSRPTPQGTLLRIAGVESPEKWGVQLSSIIFPSSNA